ncbi:MAG: acetate--CoA ligase family protein [Candidatus Odinarchaeota archaeon]
MLEAFKRVFEENRTVLTVLESKRVLEEQGFPVNKTVMIKNREELISVMKSNKLEYPLVAKIVSPEIVHKTDVGGVLLGLKNFNHTITSYDAMMESIKQKRPDATVEGIILEEEIEKGYELVIGSMTDPVFGPVLMFGLGGIFIEVLKDVVFRLIPLSEQDAQKMLVEIKAYHILDGIRGHPPVNKESLVQLILKTSDFMYNHPEVKEMDLNPVFASEDGCKVVDARIILHDNKDSRDS